MIDRGLAAMAVSTAIGVWLYIAPSILGYDEPPATSDRVAGALIVALSFVAIWEYMRGLRLFNRAVAAWLLLSVVLFQPVLEVAASTSLSATAVLLLSFVRGTIRRPYGGGWRTLVGGGRAGGE